MGQDAIPYYKEALTQKTIKSMGWSLSGPGKLPHPPPKKNILKTSQSDVVLINVLDRILLGLYPVWECWGDT